MLTSIWCTDETIFTVATQKERRRDKTYVLTIDVQSATDDIDHTHTTILRPFFRDHPGEPVPEENFWT